jgi:hypothetical protein
MLLVRLQDSGGLTVCRPRFGTTNGVFANRHIVPLNFPAVKAHGANADFARPFSTDRAQKTYRGSGWKTDILVLVCPSLMLE